MRRRHITKLVLLGTLALALVPGAARSTNSFGPKVSDSLAAVAATAGASTPLHAILYGSNLQAANADLASVMTVRQPLGAIGGESVTIPAGSLPALTAEPGVDYATLDAAVAVNGPVKAPLDGTGLVATYPLTDDAVGAWRSGITGKGVGVAIVDSGTTSENDFTSPNHLEQIKLKGQQDSNGGLNDPYGHGTFVAGIIGGYSVNGHFVGIAPNASLEAINISRPDGVRSSDVIAALLWTLAHHKDKHIGVVKTCR
jgi:serine protease AprX